MRSLPALFPFVLAALLAPRPGAQEGAQPESKGPRPKVLGVDVTFLANSGFFLESGRYSVLIDAFLREPTDVYAGVPEEVHKRLVNAMSPFDGLTVVLVSHKHADHVQMRGLEKYLGKNNEAQLLTSPDVLKALQTHSRDFPAIQRRTRPMPTVVGSVNKVLQEEMTIEFFQLAHGGPDADVVNLAHLIEMGGLRMLHVGDAKPDPENFAAYGLAARRIDVVFVPYWFFGSEAGMRTLHEQIKARIVVACHVPPSEMEKFAGNLRSQFPDVVLFQEAMEKRSFQPEGNRGAEDRKE
jgi:L-ascorbate metabolism protein UlaG (beta-lactamase superfamily)